MYLVRNTLLARLRRAAVPVAGVALLSTVALGCADTDRSAMDDRSAAIMALDAQDVTHRTQPFAGVKANTGYATHTHENGKCVLTLSDDFVIPDTPAPHWQVVDSQGNTYLLQRLKIKEDKYNQRIEVPAYVHDIAKVQIWCSWAEALLGEASFDKPVHASDASARM